MISLIVATDLNGVIAKNGKIPWHSSSEFKHFREKTVSKPIIMGKVTYDTIGMPLPDRHVIVIDQDFDSKHNSFLQGITPFWTYNNIDDALECAKNLNSDEVMICGGLSIYKYFLENGLIDKMYISKMKMTVEIEEGDEVLSFPEYSDFGPWNVVSSVDHDEFMVLELEKVK